MKNELKAKLDTVFQHMRANMCKIDLLSMYSHSIFENFPQHLPEHTLNNMIKNSKMLKDIESSIHPKRIDMLDDDQLENLGVTKDFSRLLRNISFIDLKENISDSKSIKFEQVLYSNEFISIYSYLEGFFQDVQRILYENDKMLLSNKDKLIPLDRILEADSYEEIISNVIEAKLDKSGYEKISSIIEKWKREPFKIILKLNKADLVTLEKFTSIRNVIVHNNSIINPSIMNYLDDKKYKLGQIFILNSTIMEEYRDFVLTLVLSTYVEIGSKYSML